MKCLLVSGQSGVSAMAAHGLLRGLSRLGYETTLVNLGARPDLCGLSEIRREISVESTQLKEIAETNETEILDDLGIPFEGPWSVVFNLSKDPVALRIASLVKSPRRFGFFEQPGGRFSVVGKPFRYMELQESSEKYVRFSHHELLMSALSELGHQSSRDIQGKAVGSGLFRYGHVALSPWGDKTDSLECVLLPEILACFTRKLPGTKVIVLGTFKQIEAAQRRGVDFSSVKSLCWDSSQSRDHLRLPKEVSYVATNSARVSQWASFRGIPSYEWLQGCEDESGAVLHGSVLVRASEAQGTGGADQIDPWRTMAEHMACRQGDRKGWVPHPSFRTFEVCEVADGPLILWPTIGEASETMLSTYLFKFSSWVLHFKREDQGFGDQLRSFSRVLLSRKVDPYQRFALHSHLDSIYSLHEALEGVLQRSSGVLSGKDLYSLLRGRMEFRSVLVGWLGLADDGSSSAPSMTLFFNVRLLLTHLKLQIHLASHCLRVLEGETEEIYTE